MISCLRELAEKLLLIPELKVYGEDDFNSEKFAEIQRKIFKQKKVLGLLYSEYCRPFLESVRGLPENAKIVEIGSGASPLKDLIPGVIASDVFVSPWLDISSSAFAMPFRNASLDRIFLMFSFHHLAKAEDFLDEAYRCLKPGGQMVIVDPAITPFSKFYYRYFHMDSLDLLSVSWGYPGKGRLTDSNIALPWIVFFRDKEKFSRKFPGFIMGKVQFNTCLAFLLSGGLRFRQLMPGCLIGFIFKTENWFIAHISNKIAVTMVLHIDKLPEGQISPV